MSNTDAHPNLLIIMADQHAPMFSGPYGHSVVRTPHMDRLASEGVVFDAAYCNSPLCVPSRMSFMTGRHIQHIGIWDNGVPLAVEAATWAHAVRTQGYDAALAGKQHFRGPDRLHGFRAQIARDINAENKPIIPDWSRDIQSRAPIREIRTGAGLTEEVAADDEVEAAALAYLRHPDRQTGPWALNVGFVAPHPPWTVPQPFFDMYPPDGVDLPVIPPGHIEGQHPVHQRMRRWRGLPEGPLPEESVRRARSAYYGLVTYLDEKVGRLLNALDETGLRERTVVVYTSDHGELLGEHGLWYKCSFYEQSVRIPLIISWPGNLPRRRVEEAVSLVDLTATIVELSGAPRMDWMDGDSLLSLAKGESRGWKNEAISEYYVSGVTRPIGMIRRDRFKLNYSLGDRAELYDLRDDPGEFNDLGEQPAYEDIRESLAARLLSQWNPTQLDGEVRQSQRERRLIFDFLFDW
jgi:choline-sulfatase